MDSLCRVCIKKAAKWTLLNTQIENPPSLSFLEFLNMYMSLNACETDKLPQSLCSICTRIIKTFYTFVKLAEKSDTILREAWENSISTERHNDKGEISFVEIAIKSEKIEEESGAFNKEDSFHCQAREYSTGSSLYILDIVKEEPRVSESNSIFNFPDAEINESDRFPFNLDHPEGNIEEPDDILSCIDDDLASIDAEQSDSEDDVPISFLKRRFTKNKDETDSQSNFLSKTHSINSNLKKKAGKIKAKSKEVEVTNEEDPKHGSRKQISSEANGDSIKPDIRGHTETTYKCAECDMVFNDRDKFRTHRRNHIYRGKHECNICGRKFARDKYLCNHLVCREEKKKYKCLICGKGFKAPAVLRRHMQVHSGEKPFECETCGKKFCTKQTLIAHEEDHNGIIKKCDHCDKEYTNSFALSRHMMRHTEPKLFKCIKCSKLLRSKQYLNIHMENHNGVIKTCDQCGKQFHNSHNLWRHVKRHISLKPFKCEKCSKEFINKYTLRRHMKRHTEPTPFKCEKCSKKFSSKYILDIHMENHSGIKKKCDKCDKVYKNSDTLKKHLRWHINPKPFKCVNCRESFSWKHSYTRHMKICKPVSNSN